MDFTMEIEGTSPLLMHNPRMVDPDYEITRAIKELTGKRKKTDADLEKIAMLEWYGGLHVETAEDGKQQLVQPCSKVRKALINAGKVSKQGKHVERAVDFKGISVPLTYDGPDDIDALYQDPKYVSKLSVVITGKRVMRVRPQFPTPWGLRLEGVFIEDAGLNSDEFERIATLSGQISGIGDNRVNGYGRFNSKLTWR